MSAETQLQMRDLAGLALSRVEAVFELVDAHREGFETRRGKTHLYLALGKSVAYLVGFTVRHAGEPPELEVRPIAPGNGITLPSVGSRSASVPRPTTSDHVDAGVTCAGVALTIAGASLATGPIGIAVAIGSVLVAATACGIRVETLMAHMDGEHGFYESDPIGQGVRVTVDSVDLLLGAVSLRTAARGALGLVKDASRALEGARLVFLELPSFVLASDNLLGPGGSLYSSEELLRVLEAHARRSSTAGSRSESMPASTRCFASPAASSSCFTPGFGD